MGNKSTAGYTRVATNDHDVELVEFASDDDNTAVDNLPPVNSDNVNSDNVNPLNCYQLVVRYGLDWPEVHNAVTHYGAGVYDNMIYDWIVTALQTPTPEVIASLQQLITDHNYRPTYDYYTVPEALTDPTTIGYKLVCCKQTNGPIRFTICALLELAVDAIYISGTGQPVALNQLTAGEKYCTGRATVVNATIIGQTTDCMKAVSDLMNGRLQLVSNFDYKFIYELGQTVCEPNFGKQGAGCVQGIHFFINKAAAVRFIKTGFISIDNFSPVATNKIESSDLKDILTVDARERYIYKKISEMKKQLAVLTACYEESLAASIQQYTASYWSRHMPLVGPSEQRNVYQIGAIPSQIIN